MDFEPASDEFMEMLRHACLAGACSIVSRLEPGEAKAMLRIADEHSAKAGTLLSALKGGACQQARPPYRRR